MGPVAAHRRRREVQTYHHCSFLGHLDLDGQLPSSLRAKDKAGFHVEFKETVRESVKLGAPIVTAECNSYYYSAEDKESCAAQIRSHCHGAFRFDVSISTRKRQREA